MDTTKVELDKPKSFLEVTCQSKNDSKTVVSLKPALPWVTVHKIWELWASQEPAAAQQVAGYLFQVVFLP